MKLEPQFIGVATFAACLVSPVFAQNAPVPEAPVAEVVEAEENPALASARDHLAKGRWEMAIAAAEEVLAEDPGNEDASMIRDEAASMLDRGSTIDAVVNERSVLLKQARVEFEASMQRGGELLEREDYSGATNVVLTGRVKLSRARNLFTTSEFTGLYESAEALLLQIDEARALQQQVEQELAIRNARDEKSAADTPESGRIERSINEKILRVRQLQEEQKYAEALKVVDEILFLDPSHPAGLAMRDLIRTSKIYVDYMEQKRLQEYTYTEQTLEVQGRFMMPVPNIDGPGMRGINEVLQYPEDWEELSQRRYDETGYAPSAKEKSIYRSMQSEIPLEFTDAPFSDVLSWIENATGLNIHQDWTALDELGVTEDTEVSINVPSVKVEDAFRIIFEQVNDGADPTEDGADYAIRNGLLTVTSRSALDRDYQPLVYDIRDLTFPVPYFDDGPRLDLGAALSQGGQQGGQGGGGGGGGGGFGGGGGGSLFGDADDDGDAIPRGELVNAILELIYENVPADWGGDAIVYNRNSKSTIKIFPPLNAEETAGGDNLVIYTAPKWHKQIGDLLDMLRDIRAIQINMEARVLNVSTDWFERIGIDLDMYFNTNDNLRQQQLAMNPLGHLSDFFGEDGTLRDPLLYGGFDQVPIPGQQQGGQGGQGGGGAGGAGGAGGNPYYNAIPWGGIISDPESIGEDAAEIPYISTFFGAPLRATEGFAPFGVLQNSFDILDSVGSDTAFASALGNQAPAFSSGIQFLDDVQVDLLVEATQADDRSVVLTAPRLTFFNGQRAWMALQRQEAFVSGLVPITGTATGAFQPIIGRVSSGITLDVSAVVSADRRYVQLTSWFDSSELVELKKTAFTGAAGGGGGGFGGPGGGGGGGGGAGGAGGGVGNFAGEIELPIIAVNQIRTTVSVPDKGTVMLGGQRQVDEFETEVGVPMLSKIPWVNRFFTNRKQSKSEKTVLFLMRPEIIIQEETEDVLFPGLSETLGYGSTIR